MLDVMHVPQTISVLRKKRSLSSSSVSSLLAIGDGLDTAGPEAMASCLVEVETLESSFAELEDLRIDIEAQTSRVRKPG